MHANSDCHKGGTVFGREERGIYGLFIMLKNFAQWLMNERIMEELAIRRTNVENMLLRKGV